MTRPDAQRASLRALLRTRRANIPPHARQDAVLAMQTHLDTVLAQVHTMACYWPYDTEPDLRDWMAQKHAAGCTVALPVVVNPAQALQFREWHPDATLEKGAYGIAVPQATRTILPQALVIPALGFNEAGFRLGYGAGLYDRTLAAWQPPPLTVGIAFEICKVPDFAPEPHDVPLDCIVTECGIYRR